MVTGDGRLDHAGSLSIGLGRHGEQRVTRMLADNRKRCVCRARGRLGCSGSGCGMPGYCITDDGT